MSCSFYSADHKRFAFSETFEFFCAGHKFLDSYITHSIIIIWDAKIEAQSSSWLSKCKNSRYAYERRPCDENTGIGSFLKCNHCCLHVDRYLTSKTSLSNVCVTADNDKSTSLDVSCSAHRKFVTTTSAYLFASPSNITADTARQISRWKPTCFLTPSLLLSYADPHSTFPLFLTISIVGRLSNVGVRVGLFVSGSSYVFFRSCKVPKIEPIMPQINRLITRIRKDFSFFVSFGLIRSASKTWSSSTSVAVTIIPDARWPGCLNVTNAFNLSLTDMATLLLSVSRLRVARGAG
mmetsp:Transcript_12892/g.27374  ORF Transcript_12892/g.27374 Transcript_12892/m.27374 type:complete len:293 (+) Transcript_12892:1350-2228(+)